MERLFELGALLDCYGAMLTARQQSIMSQYADENCSLSEIAEREGISRQGVRDTLHRGEQQLRTLEDAIGLIQTRSEQQTILHRMTRYVASAPTPDGKRAALNGYIASLLGTWEDEDGI